VTFRFSIFIRFLALFQDLQCAIFIFDVFMCFLPYSRLYSVCVSFSTFFSFFHHNLGPTVCIFPLFTFFFYCFLHFSRSYSVCFSFSTFFSFFAIFQVLFCTFLIFQVFQCFSPYSCFYQGFFTFFFFFSFLAIFQFIQCAFLIFHIFQCFSPYSWSYSVCFILHVFQCFLPYSKSYSVWFLFSTFFTFSCHFPGPIVCVSQFARFSMFLAIFQILPCFSHFPRLSVF